MRNARAWFACWLWWWTLRGFSTLILTSNSTPMVVIGASHDSNSVEGNSNVEDSFGKSDDKDATRQNLKDQQLLLQKEDSLKSKNADQNDTLVEMKNESLLGSERQGESGTRVEKENRSHYLGSEETEAVLSRENAFTDDTYERQKIQESMIKVLDGYQRPSKNAKNKMIDNSAWKTKRFDSERVYVKRDRRVGKRPSSDVDIKRNQKKISHKTQYLPSSQQMKVTNKWIPKESSSKRADDFSSRSHLSHNSSTISSKDQVLSEKSANDKAKKYELMAESTMERDQWLNERNRRRRAQFIQRDSPYKYHFGGYDLGRHYRGPGYHERDHEWDGQGPFDGPYYPHSQGRPHGGGPYGPPHGGYYGRGVGHSSSRGRPYGSRGSHDGYPYGGRHRQHSRVGRSSSRHRSSSGYRHHSNKWWQYFDPTWNYGWRRWHNLKKKVKRLHYYDKKFFKRPVQPLDGCKSCR